MGLVLNRKTGLKKEENGAGGGYFSHPTHHDENLEGLPWLLLLLVHPAQQVVADDVDRAGLQAVFGLHHHVDAVRTQRWEPAPKGLRAQVNTIKNNPRRVRPALCRRSIIQPPTAEDRLKKISKKEKKREPIV